MMNLDAVSMQPFGDRALYIKFGDGIDASLQKKIQAFMLEIENYTFAGYIESVPAYNNITIYYDPLAVLQGANIRPQQFAHYSPFEIVKHHIAMVLTQTKVLADEQTDIITIPVVYGGEFGPDLAAVAAHNNLSEAEVIARHIESEYIVYMLGFAPGFPFLGGMNDSIAMPRKQTPRLKIPAGSVGIAGKQTGIYPLETPGGWQIIGRAAVDLFTPQQNPPALLRAGNKIRFEAITPEIFHSIREGSY